LRAVKRGQTYARHRVFFADEMTAIAAGFRPCAVCMRAAYDRWKAQAGTGKAETTTRKAK
jgi:methylphosphotriester-DNA--protein-cysteine methyltransferase